MGLESLRDRRWCRKLCLFHRVLENVNSKNLFSLIPTRRSLYSTRNIHHIPLVDTKYNFFKNSFFPSTVIEWNNLDLHLRKSEKISVFKSNILKFIRPSPNSVYCCHNPRGICHIIRLELGLSHLREHKFKHSFQDTLNPLCTLKKQTLWLLFMDGVQLPQCLSHFEEAVYFLPLSSQKFLVLILSTSEG